MIETAESRPLLTLSEGYTQSLMLVDVMLGYTILHALKTKDMEDTARALWGIFTEIGIPKNFQLDNGLQVNQLVC